MPIIVVLCAQRPCEQPVDMAGENMSLEALFSPLHNDGFLLGWHLMVVIFSFLREENCFFLSFLRQENNCLLSGSELVAHEARAS